MKKQVDNKNRKAKRRNVLLEVKPLSFGKGN